MKTPYHGIRRRLAKAALALSLGAAATTIAIPDTAFAKPMKFDFSGLKKTKYRLRMVVEVQKTTDSNENKWPGSDNSEDEVYYSLAGVKIIDGDTTTLTRKEVRPNSSSKDVWEMGPNSNDALHRVLFEHDLNMVDQAAFTLVLSEQDNAQLNEIEQLIKNTIKAGVQYLSQEMGASDFLGTGKFDDKKALDTLISDTKQLIGALGDRQDQPIGVVEIKIDKGAKLILKGVGSGASTVSAHAQKGAIQLTGFKSKYLVKFYLEDGNQKAPINRVFLDKSGDKCGDDNLWVDGKDGLVLIAKGESKDVYLGGEPGDRYHWHCGSKDEDDSSNPPDGTNLAVTTRAASGRDIRWMWYSETRAKPDYK
jgi:hypothetical protein